MKKGFCFWAGSVLVLQSAFPPLPRSDPSTLGRWGSCFLRWHRTGAGLRELYGNMTGRCCETYSKEKHICLLMCVSPSYYNVKRLMPLCTSPAPLCPISASSSSPHLPTSSSFGNQLLGTREQFYNVWHHVKGSCLLWRAPSVVWMFPLNSLSVSLSRKLDFPDPASPAKTRRYNGAGSPDSSMSSSEGWENDTESNNKGITKNISSI